MLPGQIAQVAQQAHAVGDAVAVREPAAHAGDTRFSHRAGSDLGEAGQRRALARLQVVDAVQRAPVSSATARPR